jgi:hypothetical protein
LIFTPLSGGLIVTNDYIHHPLADLFPMMPERSFGYLALLEIIRIQGPAPITLYEGMILGGRHEFRACRDLGIEPEFVEYDGDDPLGFVLRRSFVGPYYTQAQRALFVEEHTSWSMRGRDRKSGRGLNGVVIFERLQSRAKPGVKLVSLVPFSFSTVQRLHTARNRRLKDSDGKDIPNTRALLPEIIESVRDGKIETVGKVHWLSEQPHENQRKFVANIKFKGQKIERSKRGTTSDAAKIARVFDAAPDEDKAQFLKSSGLVWWRDHKHEHGG